MFLGRRRRSREESPEWICESRCLQVSVRLPQSAFYSQSAVFILHSVCILPLVRSLQSAVRSLRFTLTGKTINASFEGVDINANFAFKYVYR